jgi:gamma-glutamylcyclotransferase (GGCT)/AIG2-like uncharacterized protein YtfP
MVAFTSMPDDPGRDDLVFFAYGANLSRAHMAVWCRDALPIASARLRDHRLVFRTWADITASPGDVVQGAIYHISPRDLAALDEFVDCPALYSRTRITVETRAGSIEAMTYCMNSGHPLALPDAHYFALVLQGYEDWGLDTRALTVTAEETW